MKLVFDIAIFVNLVTVIVFALGAFFAQKKDVLPKTKANWGVAMAIFMVIYLFCLTLLALLGLVLKDYNLLSLLLFVAAPFVIGYFVKYQTVKKYTILQIAAFICSLVVLIIL